MSTLDRKDFDIYNRSMSKLKKYFIILITFLFSFQLFAGPKEDLLKAVSDNSSKDVKKIIYRNSNIIKTRFDDMDNTILMIALEKECNSAIIDMLLKAGCNPDAKNKDGQTALMIACKKSYGEKIINKIINFNLLSKKSKIKRITRQDINGKTSFDYAINNSNALATLEKYTQDPKKVKTEESKTKDSKQKEKDLKQNETAQSDDLTVSTQIVAEYKPETLPETNIEAQIPEPIISPTSEPVELEEKTETEMPIEENIKVVENKPEVQAESIEEEKTIVETDSIENIDTAVIIETVQPQAETVQPQAETVIGEQDKEIIIPEITEPILEIESDTIAKVSTQTELPKYESIDSSINIPKIDYYNRNKPEYLFDELETEQTSLEQIQSVKPVFIENPDILDNLGRTKLINAIIESNPKLCYDLLNSGADANFKDKDGWTPLMYACKYAKDADIVKLLISFNANINEKNNFNTSTLEIMAAHCNNLEVLSILLEYSKLQKIDINNSFIIALKQERNLEIIMEYKKFISNINFMKNGKTPLMYASQYYEKTDVIKFLLECGADPYIISSEKKNAFSYAKENTKIVKDSVYWSLNVSSQYKR